VTTLLRIAGFLDAVNERVGTVVRWLVLLSIALAAINAVFGHWLGPFSNSLLESQWYLFAAVFLLVAGYTLQHNGHVRIDIIYGRLSPKRRALIDLAGSAVFLLPFCALMVWLSWPGFIESFVSSEHSPDAGGLLRWPVRALIPLGFALLALQGVAQILHSVAILRGASAPSARSTEERV